VSILVLRKYLRNDDFQGHFPHGAAFWASSPPREGVERTFGRAYGLLLPSAKTLMIGSIHGASMELEAAYSL
jgi:hypothetical protein